MKSVHVAVSSSSSLCSSSGDGKEDVVSEAMPFLYLGSVARLGACLGDFGWTCLGGFCSLFGRFVEGILRRVRINTDIEKQ